MFYKSTFLFLVVFAISSVCLGQNKSSDTRISLEFFLQSLQDQYNIKFAYKTDTIEEELITTSAYQNLEEALRKIERDTPFFVEKVDDRYYLILSKTAPDKITVCGQLVTEFSNIPIPDAKIVNVSNGKQTSSDINGYFNLYLSSPKDSITISGFGLRSKLVIASAIYQTPCRTIPLVDLMGQYLDEVLITQYLNLSDSGFKSENNSEFSFDPNNIGVLPNLAEPDILETLKVLPGIQSISESATKLLIRGGNSDENLLYWDGIRMYDTGHLFGTLSSYNPYITDEVKLYRGGTNPKYGNGLAGVIEINSPKKIPKKLTGNAGISLNLADVNLRIPVTKKIGIFTSIRRAYLDVLDTGTLRKYQERIFQRNTVFQRSQLGNSEIISGNTDFGFLDFTFKNIYKINTNHQVNFSFIHSDDKAVYRNRIFENTPSSVNGIEETRIIGDIEAFIKKTNYGGGISWDGSFDKNFTHHINVYYSNYQEISEEDNFREREANNVVFGLTNMLSNELKDVGVSGELEWRIGNHLKLQGGYDFSNVQITRQRDQQFKQVETQGVTLANEIFENFNDTQGVFYSLNFNISNKLKGRIGSRHTRFSASENQNWLFEPRIAFRYQMSKHLTLRSSFEQKNQILVQDNDTYDEIELTRSLWSLNKNQFGNVPVRNGNLGSAGIVYSKNKWAFDLDLYRKKTKNLSENIEGLHTIINQEDTGFSETYGVDFLTKKSFNDYNIILSYSYLDQQFTFQRSNQGLPFKGIYNTTHSFSVSQNYKIKKIELAMSWRYRSGLPYSNTVRLLDETDPRGEIVVENFNNDRFKGFHRLDFKAVYPFAPFKKKDIQMKGIFSVLNVYNQKNEIGVLYQPVVISENTDTGEKTYTIRNSAVKSLGLTANFTLRVLF